MLNQACGVVAASVVLGGVASSGAIAQLAPFVEHPTGTWTALSADGEVAVRAGARWVRGQGISTLPNACGICRAVGGAGVSWDGSRVAFTVMGDSGTSTSNGQTGALWTVSDGTRLMRAITPGIIVFNAEDICASGEYIIGRGRTTDSPLMQLMRWSAAGGMELITDPGFSSGYAISSSYDGRVLVGTASNSIGVRWTPATGFERLDATAPTTASVVPTACSADGAVVVGVITTGSGFHAWRWTRETGIVELPFPAGVTGTSYAYGISSDGRVIVGDAGANRDATIWDAANGTRFLRSVVTLQSGTDPGVLGSARGISADGRTIGGIGFVLRLNAPCPSDVDDGTMRGARDGAVNTDDLMAMVEWMAEGSLLADLDNGLGQGVPDAAVTIEDLLYFLQGYVNGC